MKKSIIASLLIACSLFIGGNTDARAEYPLSLIHISEPTRH